MKYYLDCEFDEHNGELLSLALIGEIDDLYVVTFARAASPWVQENVVPILFKDNCKDFHIVPQNLVGTHIRDFLEDDQHPTIIADSPVDIYRFCRALSTDPEGNWASTGFERMTFEVHNVECYPTTLEGAIQHNAWWDARALRHRLELV